MVTLRALDPPIWRRLLVPGSVILLQLHRILQIAMEWEDYHLYAFNIAGVEYGEPDPDWPPGVKVARRVKLEQVITRRCIDGSRACPPDDCGGFWGYSELLEIIDDSGHEEHMERME